MVRYLEENRLSTNNPSFILKERCEELAFSQGMPLRSFLVFPYVSSIVGKKTIRFSQETIPATLDTSKASYIWNNNSISARLAYFICTLYNISADFLFLQDYSDRVVWKGEALSADLQTSFSAFLCATKSAQDVAIQNLVQFLLRY